MSPTILISNPHTFSHRGGVDCKEILFPFSSIRRLTTRGQSLWGEQIRAKIFVGDTQDGVSLPASLSNYQCVLVDN